MFVRPLAYKGPSDHLSLLFSDGLLLQALGWLSGQREIEWHYQQQMQWVEAVFYSSPNKHTPIKCQISWPLSLEGLHCNCGLDSPCIHMAALAIESKVRLDQLPFTLRDGHDKFSLWQSSLTWLRQQQFNPYPNMARHRVVYLLKPPDASDPENDSNGKYFWISMYKAYLTQDNKYVLKDKLDLSTILSTKLPKFITLHDQNIIHAALELPKNRWVGNHGVRLSGQETETLFQEVVESQRCFWKASSRPAMKYLCVDKIEANWLRVSQQFWIDVSSNTVIHHVQAENNQNGLDTNPVVSIRHNSLSPHLRIETHTLDISGISRPADIDIGRVTFCDQQGRHYTFENLLDYASLTPEQFEFIGRHLRYLQAVETVKGGTEWPIAKRFSLADRLLTSNIGQLIIWLRGLQQVGWTIEFAHNFRFNVAKPLNWFISVKHAEDQLQLSIDVDLSNETNTPNQNRLLPEATVNLLPILVKAIKTGQIDPASFNQNATYTLRLPDGQPIALEGARLKSILLTLIELTDARPLGHDDLLYLPVNHISRLSLLQNLDPELQWRGEQELLDTAQSLAASHTQPAIAIPNAIRTTLRSYQIDGFRWLVFLYHNRLGGILADDMGLGKTVQSLTFLVYLKQLQKSVQEAVLPNLVVAPTSLIANWQAEAEKFAPDLNVQSYYGSDRQNQWSDLQRFDLVITTYGVLSRDIRFFKTRSFQCVILDEAQAIKNAKTRIAKSCFQLQAEFRVCLSGTPIENHLGELWSQFQFLMPGFLGSEAQFNRLYRLPIEKERHLEVQKSLAMRIQPFLLRRTKDKVATELPKKTELIQLLDLHDEQSNVYEAFRISMNNELRHVIANKSTAKNALLISNAILRLRQICCHPQLLDLPSAQSTHQSTKIDWLKTVLPEMIEEGRRILLFSSFTQMLKLIEKELKALRINYLTLTGQSVHRGELVKRFQTGEVPVFLISLKAGGAGLNLTAADTVIHFDPWWNPAAEDQASDRAHRIGQDKPVFVYKLICRNTVEQRIFDMQKTKQNLSESLYRESESIKSPSSAEQWLELLQPIDSLSPDE